MMAQDNTDTPGMAPADSRRLQAGPYALLTPTQRAVYALLEGYPISGVCRRDFADHDIFEVSNRITEIEQRLGIVISREPCRQQTHRHRRRILAYHL